MTNPIDTQFREDIAKRIAEMKARNKEKTRAGREGGNPSREVGRTDRLGATPNPPQSLEETAREVFGVPEEKIVDVNVEVPLMRNGRPFFNLNRKFIEKAKREGKIMRITWPDGSALHRPEDWLKDGEPYQKSFKFADKPMEMLGHFLDHE